MQRHTAQLCPDLNDRPLNHYAIASLNDTQQPSILEGLSQASSVIVVADRGVVAFDSPFFDSLITSGQADVVFLDSDRDGIAQITEILKFRTNLAALYIVAYGSPSCFYLGNSCLSQETLMIYASQIRQWADSLTADAFIVFHGCGVAAEPMRWKFGCAESGDSFYPMYAQLQTPLLRCLHQLIGRAIAASTAPFQLA